MVSKTWKISRKEEKSIKALKVPDAVAPKRKGVGWKAHFILSCITWPYLFIHLYACGENQCKLAVHILGPKQILVSIFVRSMFNPQVKKMVGPHDLKQNATQEKNHFIVILFVAGVSSIKTNLWLHVRNYYLLVFEALSCWKKDHTTCKAIKTGLENDFFSRVPFWLRSHFERCGPILNWNPFCRSKVDFECFYCIHSRRSRKVNAIYFFLRLVRSLESRHSQHYATRKFADCNVRDSLTYSSDMEAVAM